MARRGSPYGRAYERARARLLAGRPSCELRLVCDGSPATEADHVPPLATHVHREGSGCCRLQPACGPCQRRQALLLATGAPVKSRDQPTLTADTIVGFPADDDRWRVPWLAELLDVPDDATWPRFMTAPHPDAVGSLGAEFAEWALLRSGRPLRWWQRLVAARMLETDVDGALVWTEVLLTLGRQVGKSWFLRELFLWRIRQGDRFGEPQLVVHTGKDMAICKEVQLPARVWAKQQPGTYKVRETNGSEEIEWLPDGSRWLLRARDSVYGYSASLAGVDEAWRVSTMAVEDGLAPTMVEREQPQLVLVSTAHRAATPLFVTRRLRSLGELAAPTIRQLLVEWSSPATLPRDDPAGWRMASPHWTERRAEQIAGRLAAAESGAVDDPDEPDPLAAFDCQWRNIWPESLTGRRGPTDRLVPAGVWPLLAGSARSGLPAVVAVDDNHGDGAGVCAVVRDGAVFECDGWTRPTWELALADAVALVASRPRSRLVLSRTVASRAPDIRPVELAGVGDTRAGLALFRDLVGSGALVHDDTPELDEQLEACRIRRIGAGLTVVSTYRADLVRGLVWALRSAHERTRTPSVH